MGQTESTSANTAAAIDDAHAFRPQLFKLGAVLNGLDTGATAMHKRILQVMTAMHSGTYEIDPLQLSRRIIGDTLRSRS